MPNQYTSAPSASVLVPCVRCATVVPRWPSQLYSGRLTFCSRRCHAASKLESALAKLREPAATRLPNGCLIFNGPKNARGYGRLKARGVNRPAHVLAWELANGQPFPPGKLGCHNCPGGDTPSCVEPTHIWPGTSAENSADAVTKGTMRRGAGVTSAKLTDDAVRAIRQRYRAGSVSQAHLANEYGISQRTVSVIVLRQGWKHVTP